MHKENDVKMSCYIDKETYKEFKNKASSKGLSISAYLRFLIKQELSYK